MDVIMGLVLGFRVKGLLSWVQGSLGMNGDVSALGVRKDREIRSDEARANHMAIANNTYDQTSTSYEQQQQ